MVSIIIPLYNKEASIKNTIESVLNQDYYDIEVVIINDGSTDNSIQIVSSILDNRIKLISKPNGGVSSARNYGIKHAQGEYILFLDADDILYPNALSTLIRLHQTYNVDITCGNYHTTRNKIKKIFSHYKFEGIISSNLYSYYMNKFSMRTGVALFKREILKHISFNESLSRYEDLSFIIEACHIAKIAITPIPVMEYTCEFKSLSINFNNPSKDFTYNMNFYNKSFWEKLLLGQLLVLANNPQALKKQYKIFYSYSYVAWIGFKVKKIIRILNIQ